MKKKEHIIIIILTIILFIGIGGIFCLNNNVTNKQQNDQNDSVEPKDISIETASDIDSLQKKIKEEFKLSDDVSITYQNIDTAIADRSLRTTTIYLDSGDKKISKDVAMGNDRLKDGYASKEVITGNGTYNVRIVDNKNNKTYETTLTVSDKEAPTLEVREVTITLGDSLNIDNIVSCSDNSNSQCKYTLYDKAGNEIKELPTNVGTHTIKVVASDDSGNKSDEKEVKIIIKDKKQDTNSSNNNSTSGTSSNNNSSNTNNNSSSSNNTNNSSNKSTNPNDYDQSNPIVKKALAQVGKSQICSETADIAMSAVGKALDITNYIGVKNFVTGQVIGNSDGSFLKDHTFTTNETVTDNDTQYTITRKFYVKNNVVTKIEFTNCPSETLSCYGKQYDTENPFLNFTAYRYSEMYVLAPENIKQIANQVSISDARPGDFLYYANGGNGSSHIAVYIGKEMAVHGGWSGKVVIFSMYLPSGNPTVWRLK